MIRRSKFIVADFTGDRGGVYFEAGFALGLGLQVIWTVEKDQLKNVHFDNRQYSFLKWSSDGINEFRDSLQFRVEATIGRGPIVCKRSFDDVLYEADNIPQEGNSAQAA